MEVGDVNKTKKGTLRSPKCKLCSSIEKIQNMKQNYVNL